MRSRGTRLGQPPATTTASKCDSLCDQGLTWLGVGQEKPAKGCVEMSSGGRCLVAVPSSHTEEESEQIPLVGGQRRLWEVEGGPLNQAGTRRKGNVHVAGVKKGAGKALGAEGHSGMSGREQKQRRLSGLVSGRRPEVGGVQTEQVRKPTGTRKEEQLPQAPRRICGFPQELLCTPYQGGLDMSPGESCPCPYVSPGGCRRQRHRLHPRAGGARRAGKTGQGERLGFRVSTAPTSQCPCCPSLHGCSHTSSLCPISPQGQSNVACSPGVKSCAQKWRGPKSELEDTLPSQKRNQALNLLQFMQASSESWKSGDWVMW